MNSTVAYSDKDPVMVAVQAKLAEKIKLGFVELIPNEVFDKMTSTAIDEFINGPFEKRYVKRSEFISKGGKIRDDVTGIHKTAEESGTYITITIIDSNKYNPDNDPAT